MIQWVRYGSRSRNRSGRRVRSAREIPANGEVGIDRQVLSIALTTSLAASGSSALMYSPIWIKSWNARGLKRYVVIPCASCLPKTSCVPPWRTPLPRRPSGDLALLIASLPRSFVKPLLDVVPASLHVHGIRRRPVRSTLRPFCKVRALDPRESLLRPQV